MTRLEILCKAHKQQGGTIFQFNKQYDEDFIAMNDLEFINFINSLNADIRFNWDTYEVEEK